MSGGGTGTGDLFNAGAAIVKGIEISATYEIQNNPERGYKLPLTFSYTLTDTKLNSDLVRIQSERGIMETHNKFNERGKEIEKLIV